MQLQLDRGSISIVGISIADEIYLEHLGICKTGDILNLRYNKPEGYSGFGHKLESISQSEANNIKEADIMNRMSIAMKDKPPTISLC
jgi:hypothetical protein